jgi:NADP-dependent 3-hydroxy acid dehydrogenase YdfG
VLGQVLAAKVMSQGDYVIATCADPRRIQWFNRHYSGRSLGVVLDESDLNAIERFAKWLPLRFKRLDVWVHQATLDLHQQLDDAPPTQAKMIIENRFLATLALHQHLLPQFCQQQFGDIFQIHPQSLNQQNVLLNAVQIALHCYHEAMSARLVPYNVRLQFVEWDGSAVEAVSEALLQALKIMPREPFLALARRMTTSRLAGITNDLKNWHAVI